MKICPICGGEISDDSRFCTLCGTQLPEESRPVPAVPAAFSTNYKAPESIPDPFDHTRDFDETDIHDNKLFALLMYLTSIVGIFLALLGANDSPYVQFHLKQNMKFLIVEVILGLCASVLFFTFIVPIAAGICLTIVEIIRIISFIQVCGNKAKEPAIIRSLGFLK